jgi:hypothetical protein
LSIDNSLLGSLGTNGLGGDLEPSKRLCVLGEPLFRLRVKEAHLDPSSDNSREASVTHGTTDNVVGLGDVVELTVNGAVTVGVADKVVRRGEVVRLGGAHELLSGNLNSLAVLDELGVVLESEEDTARRPAEAVAKSVVGIDRSSETTAHALELENLTALLVNLVDGLDGPEVLLG